MQLSMQCTWISLNLSRVCNQARRWVEGKFSSSKCASISQMCKREPPRAGHHIFIAKGKPTSRYTLHWAIFGGDRRCTVASVAKPTDARPASVALYSRHVSQRAQNQRSASSASDASDARDPAYKFIKHPLQKTKNTTKYYYYYISPGHPITKAIA